MTLVLPAPEREIQVAYKPRPHFRALHASTKRWIFMCCHRRPDMSFPTLIFTLSMIGLACIVAECVWLGLGYR